MALDPVEVARLLEAASRTQWPTQKSVREAVDARLTLREIAPEIAADWLRLRALLDALGYPPFPDAAGGASEGNTE